ncbi:MAG: hypothetical protein BGN86_07730 [Caulobacterales bacterium 68-7]|nr:hypothetical protein [Caulobacterales bacterium]OJU10859.1 MAG: hypothetical protein BGN86_07730 [Caulobacterales bacterium 68-7]
MIDQSPFTHPLEREVYAVVHYPEGWRILTHGQRWGRFAFRVDAEEAALRLAAKAEAAGQRAEVLVQDTSCELSRLDTGNV